MSFQVRNDQGVVTLDIQDRITRFNNVVPLTASGSVHSGFISVPGMVDDGTWVVVGGMSNDVSYAIPVAYTTIGVDGFTWIRFGVAGPFDTSFMVLRV
ncbi:hypothetical protein [Rhizobacter sp. Root1221]|uniref:hypothetical protein n=1 Tax=Rhizobacter sp. Root1221 TaxID=1736433 RepID=UPI0006F21082|nr:hypothetical protein [Rhizobacter sp. Root1221]KQV99963.1 hypothetical protein ASC87_19880 [Rhizobacter sp. Root1221]